MDGLLLQETPTSRRSRRSRILIAKAKQNLVLQLNFDFALRR
jgi:hypothetical protein